MEIRDKAQGAISIVMERAIRIPNVFGARRLPRLLFLGAPFALGGCFGASGGITALFSKGSSESNSAPQVQDLRITSVPPRRERSPGGEGGLVGRVVVEYTVVDKESNPVDLELVVEFGDNTVSLKNEGLSESMGMPSEGLSALSSSPEGTSHRFVWNSDWDMDREGIDSPRAVRFLISVKETGSSRKPKEGLMHLDFVDNRRVHTVAGFVPELEEDGAQSTVAFGTLSAMDIGDNGRKVYMVDSGAHRLWSTGFADEAKVALIAGSGILRGDEEALPDFNIAKKAMLRDPIDIVVDESQDRDVVYFLEQASCLWSMDGDRMRLELDGRAFLDNPRAFALEFLEDQDRRFAYIGDVGNCRVVRYDLDSGEARVIAGELRDLSPPPGFSHGCDKDGVGDQVNEPRGLMFYRSEAGKRVLFVSSTKDDRIVRVDLGPGDDPDAFLKTPKRPDVLLDKTGDPKIPELCQPTALRLIDNEVYITCVGAHFDEGEVKGRGVVLKVPLIERGGLPSLGTTWERVCGGFLDSNGKEIPPTCRSGESLPSTYRPEDECQPAKTVPLAEPTDVIADGNGGIYVCDSRNQRIRKIEEACNPPDQPQPAPEGPVLRTFVGGSAEGRSGPDVLLDNPCPPGEPLAGSPALSYKLSEPLGMALIDDRLLLICDRGNDRIVRLDLQTGTIACIAGCQQNQEEKDQDVRFGGDGGRATEALLHVPRSIAVFPSKDFCQNEDRAIYIADSRNHRVRKIDKDGVISTFAGTGDDDFERLDGRTRADPLTVSLKLPRGVATDSRGRVLISDCFHRILIVDTAPGGDGMLRRAIGDAGEDRSAADDPCGTRLSRDIRDGKSALEARLNQPSEMAFDPMEEFLYFTDLRHFRVRRARYNIGDGTCSDVETIAGTGERNDDATKPTERQDARTFPLAGPLGVDLDPEGRFLFFSDPFGASAVYRVELGTGSTPRPIELIAGGNRQGSAGEGDMPIHAEFANLNAIQIDSSGKAMYVVDSRNHRIRRFFIDTER